MARRARLARSAAIRSSRVPCSTPASPRSGNGCGRGPSATIAVVGHGTFFYHLTGTFLENCGSVELDLDAAPAAA